jgi:hypothetical protein
MAIAVLSRQETKSRLAPFKLASWILSNDESPSLWASGALRTEGGVSGVWAALFCLQRWPVSKRVNSSKADADDATLIEQVVLKIA